MRLSIKQAKHILDQSGEVWRDRYDLRRIYDRVYDPIIKRACAVLIIQERKYGHQ